MGHDLALAVTSACIVKSSGPRAARGSISRAQIALVVLGAGRDALRTVGTSTCTPRPSGAWPPSSTWPRCRSTATSATRTPSSRPACSSSGSRSPSRPACHGGPPLRTRWWRPLAIESHPGADRRRPRRHGHVRRAGALGRAPHAERGERAERRHRHPLHQRVPGRRRDRRRAERDASRRGRGRAGGGDFARHRHRRGRRRALRPGAATRLERTGLPAARPPGVSGVRLLGGGRRRRQRLRGGLRGRARLRHGRPPQRGGHDGLHRGGGDPALAPRLVPASATSPAGARARGPDLA